MNRRMDVGQTTYKSVEAKHRRLLRQEELLLEVTEALTECLASQDLNQAELARRLGRTRSYLSQLFAGGRNLTLRTLADVADALDCRVKVKLLSRVELQAAKRGSSRKLINRERLDWQSDVMAGQSCEIVRGPWQPCQGEGMAA